MRTIFVVFIFTIVIFSSYHSAMSQDIVDNITLSAECSQKYSGNVVPAATVSAVRCAKMELTRKVIDLKMNNKELTKYFKAMPDIIMSKSDQFIKDFKIIDKTFENDNATVIIKGTVSTGTLKNSIMNAVSRYAGVRVMLLLSEVFEGKLNMPGFTNAELLFIEIMEGSKIVLIEPIVIKNLFQKNKSIMQKAMRGQIDSETADLIQNKTGVDILITGKIITKDISNILQSYDRTIKTKSAIIQLKSIEIPSGRILATITSEAKGVHVEHHEASRQSIKKSLQKALVRVDQENKTFNKGRFLKDTENKYLKILNRNKIECKITGLKYGELDNFINLIIKKNNRISNVYKRKKDKNVLRITIEYAGKKSELESDLLQSSDALGYSFSIKGDYSAEVLLRVRKK